MNNVRRLFGAATTGTSTTAIETSYASYEPSSSTTWAPQLSASSGFPSPNALMGTQRPTRTPSPPPLPKLSMNSSITNSNRLPNRQNSIPLTPDDERAPSRRTNSVNSVHSQSVRSGGSKKHHPGHSKALSSFSRKLANGTASPPLPNPPAVTKPKDELIIELLASEAVVDSRNYEILGTDQIEELKRELNILSGRVAAATKKVTLETKLRDAALSLDKIQSAHRRADSKGVNGVSSSPSPALEAANVKVHNAQMELSKQVERYNEVQRQLLEHRSAVLSYSLNRLESMLKPQGESHDGSSGRTTPANQAANMNTYGGDTSPTSAVTSMSLSHRQKFEGAHFFAGHANSKLPYTQKSTKSAAQITAMEEQLVNAEKALKASKEEEEMLRREAEALRRENELATKGLSKKMQEADDTISGLQADLQRMNSTSKKLRELEDEKRRWEDDKTRLERSLQEKEADADTRVELDRKESEIRRLRDMLEQERQDHEEDRHVWEETKQEEMAQLREELEEEHAKHSENARSADVELDMASERLQALIKTHGITLSASQRRDMSLMSLINATSMHLDSIKDDARMRELEKDEWDLAKRRMESELKANFERRERLSQDLEDAQKEAETARREVKVLEERLKNAERPIPSKSSSIGSDMGSSNGSRNSTEEMDRVMTTLRSLWSLLPSREARAAAKSTGRSASPTSPLRSMASRLGEPPSPSLSDLDVRALKALYDPRNNGQSPLFSQPSNPTDFSLDAFAQRVQALVSDDRAIIERLLRFAQSHELLKNNAARAQKLAQESSMGLETYQKQVKSMEERNMTLVTKQNDLLDEINNLQATLERTQRDKRQLDIQFAEQKVALQSMTDANAVLSARTLALAEEASTAPESMRIKLEAQLNDVRAQLKESMEELEALRSSEQGQKAALLEELNLAQGENSKLRDQLRAELRKQGK